MMLFLYFAFWVTYQCISLLGEVSYALGNFFTNVLFSIPDLVPKPPKQMAQKRADAYQWHADAAIYAAAHPACHAATDAADNAPAPDATANGAAYAAPKHAADRAPIYAAAYAAAHAASHAPDALHPARPMPFIPILLSRWIGSGRDPGQWFSDLVCAHLKTESIRK